MLTTTVSAIGPGRAVEVLHDRGPATPADVRWTSGSGYLIGSRVVLTAAHNVDYRRAPGDDEQLLVRTIKGIVLTAQVVLVCDEQSRVDLALLEISDPPFGEHLLPVTFARVNRDSPAPITGCWAVGFPWFGEADPVLPEGSRKDTWPVSGHIPPGGKLRAGLLSLQVTSNPRPPQENSNPRPDVTVTPESEWAGMSGAVVFATDPHDGELAVGVISAHHLPEGESALTVIPITALTRLPAAADWWHLLGVADPDALPVLPPPSLADERGSRLAGELPVTGEPSLAGLVVKAVHGRLPRVAALDPYTLGATPSEYGDSATYGQRDQYVPRLKDDELVAALRPGRLVVLIGPSKAGKTRTAFEVLRQQEGWHNSLLADPVPQSLGKLAGHPALHGYDPLVIWLDELQRFLPPIGELSQVTISRLLDRPGRTVLLATLRAEERDRLRGHERELTREVRMVLDNANTNSIELGSTREDPAEQARAAAAYPQLGSRTEGLAEWLAGAPEVLRMYHDAASADPLLHSLVQTCVDWSRCGLPRPMPEGDLLAIARDTLEERRTDFDVRDDKLYEALQRARKGVAAEGQVALLKTHRLGDLSLEYEAFDYLVAADDGQGNQPARPVPESIWHRFLNCATDQDVSFIGVAAGQRDNVPVAVAASRRAADAGEASAMNNLGLLLEHTDPDQARQWFERAAQANYTVAMHNLGLLLEDAYPDQARRWYERAAHAGVPEAMNNLGELLKDSDPDQARQWYERAAEAGHAYAMYNLGLLLKDSDPDQARRWYERAAEAGETRAMTNLGLLLEDTDPGQARQWWQRAAQAGDAVAMHNLGVLLEDSDPDQAQQWWQRAAQAGEPSAMNNLGELLKDSDPDQARQWYERAAQAGQGAV